MNESDHLGWMDAGEGTLENIEKFLSLERTEEKEEEEEFVDLSRGFEKERTEGDVHLTGGGGDGRECFPHGRI